MNLIRVTLCAVLLLPSAVPSNSAASLPLKEVPFRRVLIDSTNLGADCIAVGDLNGDGYPDIVIADNSGAPLQWYEYPHWTRHIIDPRSAFTTDMQIGDVNRDGKPDVIVPDLPNNVMLWYQNPGGSNGEWKKHVIGSPHGHDVEIGDINGDGKLDILARDGKTTLFFQNTPDSWTRVTLDTSGRSGTELGDLNRDGRLDIAQNGYWLECPKDPIHGKWVPHEIASGWPDDVGVTLADMNGDHRLDVLLAPAESGPGKLSWYEAPKDLRSGRWTERVIDDPVWDVHTFKVADVNGDGRLDVVTAEMEQSPKKRVCVYLNAGGALRWQRQIVATTGSHNLRVADIGHDGDIDIIGCNFGADESRYPSPSDSPLEMWENLLKDSSPSKKAKTPKTAPKIAGRKRS